MQYDRTDLSTITIQLDTAFSAGVRTLNPAVRQRVDTDPHSSAVSPLLRYPLQLRLA